MGGHRALPYDIGTSLQKCEPLYTQFERTERPWRLLAGAVVIRGMTRRLLHRNGALHARFLVPRDAAIEGVGARLGVDRYGGAAAARDVLGPHAEVVAREVVGGDAIVRQGDRHVGVGRNRELGR